jgi:hypothetical protein
MGEKILANPVQIAHFSDKVIKNVHDQWETMHTCLKSNELGF